MSHSNATIASSYDLCLVGLAFVIAIIPLYIAFNLVGRNSVQGQTKIWWLFGSAIAIGSSVWSMHFIDMHDSGMAGMQIEQIGVHHKLPTLALSIAIALATSFAALWLACQLRDSTQALQDSEKCFQTLIGKMPIGVLLLGPSLEIVLSNQAAIDQLSLTDSQLLGEEVFSSNLLMLREDGTPLTQDSLPMQQALTTKEPVSNVVMGIYRSLNEDLRWFLVNAEPQLAADGSVEHITCTFSDITATKQVEAALKQSETCEREKAMQLEQTLQELKQVRSKLIQAEKMSSLGQLVAGVAHEINNPVSCIYGNLSHANKYINDLLGLVTLYQKHYPYPIDDIEQQCDAIDLDFLREDLPKLMNSLKVGAERIFQIVLSLKHFSRHDQAVMRRVDIHTGIDSTLLILQNQLRASGRYQAIKVVKEYGDLPLVECYAGQLNQVFMNILSNAIDALEEARRKDSRCSPCISISTSYNCSSYRTGETTSTEEPIADSVLIQISDNGPGMTEAVKAHLFDPFFTTKAVGKGTGLGLSISYQIVVEKLGGLLWCESELGQGTKFWIKIPVRSNCQPSPERSLLSETAMLSAIARVSEVGCTPVEIQVTGNTGPETSAQSILPEASA
jgi:signal transduction histidine kinase